MKATSFKMISNSNLGGVDKLRSDIHINRTDILDKDRRLADQEDQLLQSKKEVSQLCLYSKLSLLSD
jgi:hypothetical protein